MLGDHLLRCFAKTVRAKKRALIKQPAGHPRPREVTDGDARDQLSTRIQRQL